MKAEVESHRIYCRERKTAAWGVKGSRAGPFPAQENDSAELMNGTPCLLRWESA